MWFVHQPSVTIGNIPTCRNHRTYLRNKDAFGFQSVGMEKWSKTKMGMAPDLCWKYIPGRVPEAEMAPDVSEPLFR